MQVDTASFQREYKDHIENDLSAIERAEKWLEQWWETFPQAAARDAARWQLFEQVRTAKRLHEATPDPDQSWETRKAEWINSYLDGLPPELRAYLIDREGLENYINDNNKED